MATYKVLQDIEADDKLLGPLTLKQFIFSGVAVLCLYLNFLAIQKHLLFLMAIFLPPMLIAGFLAWPWSRDQPTEIWLLAKIRFMLKPRKRIWDQDGIQELVTITVPKKLEPHLTNNLSQTEVKSRLKALAETIDSRGWAVKNVNINLNNEPSYATQTDVTDRLIDISTLPQEVSGIDVAPADDMLDPDNNPVAQHLDQMINVSTQEHRQQLVSQVENLRKLPADNSQADEPSQSSDPQDLWFMQSQQQMPRLNSSGVQTSVPSAQDQTATTNAPIPLTKQEEQALLAQLHPNKTSPSAAYGHMKVIDPSGNSTSKNKTQGSVPSSSPLTPTTNPADPALLGLANNNDLNVATIARQAHKTNNDEPSDEVVIPLR